MISRLGYLLRLLVGLVLDVLRASGAVLEALLVPVRSRRKKAT